RRRRPAARRPCTRADRSRPASWHVTALAQAQQVASVAVLRQRRGPRSQLRLVDPAVVPGDLLRAAHPQALARLDGLDVVGRLQQRPGRAGIEPCVAAAQALQVQYALVEITAVEVGDLELAARRGLERSGEIAGAPVVEVQAGHRIVRTRL